MNFLNTFICNKCFLEKDINCFGIDKSTKTGYNYTCKECRNTILRSRYDPERTRIKNINNSNQRKQFYRSDRGIEISRRSWLLKQYNITLEEYNALNTTQNGLCAICFESEIYYRNKVLCVDHDHKTGEIRGLLCNRCNRALGLLKEEKQILLNAIKYLEKHESKN